MGSFTFKWAHAANEVYVTGTFDNWGKTVKLDKVGSVFEKHVELPDADKKIFYKFVVDGVWTTDHTALQETDDLGNTNNVLEPSHLSPLGGLGAAAISTVTPAATTAGLAGAVPKETAKDAVPGAFPVTPFETPATEPASFSVAPLPATAGAGNPIQLAPGEKVPDPSSLTSNTINSTVKLDPESYEKADAAVETGNKEVLPNETSGGMFGVPPVTGNMIPESSLPIGPGADIPSEEPNGVTIQSAGPTSTSAALAGQVPLEPRGVPEIVSESQQEVGTAPEATSNADAVEEKKAVEEELKEKVPEAPATTTTTSSNAGVSKGEIAGAVIGGAAAAGAAVTGVAIAAKEKLPESVQKPIDQAVASVSTASTAAPAVPAVVAESIQKAHESPEAAANQEAVQEKSAVEKELESKVSPVEQGGEPAPTTLTAAASAIAPALVEPAKDVSAPAAAPDAAAAPATEAAKDLAVAQPESGDVSPSTKPVDAPFTASGTDSKAAEAPSEPAATTTTAAGPATPKKENAKQGESATAKPDSQTEKSRKKKHRVSSFFGKLKEKFNS